MKKIVITGTGLAGLSAGYYLLKNTTYPIEIRFIEKADRVGGRVYTKSVNNIHYDIGAFMVFPWYKHFNALVKDLGIEKDLVSFSSVKEFYQLKDNGRLLSDESVDLLPKHKISLLRHLLCPLITGKINIYSPDLDIFDGCSLKKFFDERIHDERDLVDIYRSIISGYTYAGIEKMPAVMGISFWIQLFKNGFFKRCKNFRKEGTGLLINKLNEYIVSRGGVFSMNTEVKSFSTGMIFTDKGKEDFDYAILTHTLDSSYENVLGNDSEFNYTKHYTVLLEYENSVRINNTEDYFVAYMHQNDVDSPLIASFGSLESISLLSDKFVGVNVCVKPSDNKSYNKKEIGIIVEKQMKNLIERNKLVRVCDMIFWDKTMPDVSLSVLKKIRQLQGKDGIHFAGDYTGLPSMETAVYSGKSAAYEVVKVLK